MNKRFGNISGGVALRVIVCLVSLLGLWLAIVVFLNVFERDKTDNHRVAEQLSEYGLQVALGKLAESPDWSTEFTDEPYEDGGSFTVAFERDIRNGVKNITITSTGRSGSITRTTSRTVEFRLIVSAGGDSVWVPAALAEAGAGIPVTGMDGVEDNADIADSPDNADDTDSSVGVNEDISQ